MAVLTIENREREITNLKKDVYLNVKEAEALFGLIEPDMKKFYEVMHVRGGPSKKSVREAILRKLSQSQYVTGKIQDGITAWTPTLQGGVIVLAIGEFIEGVLKDTETVKAHTEKLDFSHRVMEGFYSAEFGTADRFKPDLLEHFGVSHNPKAGMAYDLAWRLTRERGYIGVMNCFALLIDLIR